MPRIQEYRQQARTPGAVDFQRAPLSSGLGQGLQEIGKTVNNITDIYDNYQKQQGLHSASQKTAQYALEDDKYITDAMASYNPNTYKKPDGKPDNWDYADDIAENLANKKQQRLADIDNRYERDALDQRLTNTNAKLVMDARNQKASTEARYVKENFKNNLTSLANGIRANPDRLDDFLKLNADYITTLPEKEYGAIKPGMMSESTQILYDSALDGEVTRLSTKNNVSIGEIDKAISTLKDEKGKWIKNTSKEKYDQSLTQLQKLKEHTGERNKTEFMFDFNQEMAFMADQGIDRGKYSKQSIMNMGFSAKQTEQMMRQLETSQTVAKEVTAIRDLPTTEIAKLLSTEQIDKELKADPDNYYLIRDKVAARQQAWNKRNKQYEEDRVNYVEKVNPVINQKGDQLREALKLAPNSLETVAMAEDYASSQIVEQQRLAPNESPAILDSSMISEIQFKISNVSNSQTGPEEALRILQSQHDLWGKYSDVAFKDLRTAKAISGEHYVAAQISKNPKDRQLALDIMKATVLAKDKKGKEEYKDYKEEAESVLAPLKESLGTHTVGAKGILDDYSDTIASLLQYYEDNGLKQGDAEELARRIVLDKYEFKDNLRIPKEFDSSLVSSSSKAAIPKILKLPNLNVPSDAPSRKDYEDKIKGYGKWVNYGDEGLMLINGNSGNAISTVDEKGNILPIIKSFKELEQEEYERQADFYLKSRELSRQGIQNIKDLSPEERKKLESENLRKAEEARRERIKKGTSEVFGNTFR